MFVDLHNVFGIAQWPLEFAFLQAFVPQHKARLIPVQYFQFISVPITEDKQTLTKWIHLHLLFDQHTQSISGFTKVHRIAMQVVLG